MPSVLIVEDHALFRSGLKQLIGIEPGLTVAGEAGDGLAGIRLAQSLRPDLILLDISMPELSGVEAIPRIREVAPGARILIVSMHATAGHVRAALKAGADGYLLKTADEDEFLVAIRALLKGRKYISTELTGSMIISYVDGNAAKNQDSGDTYSRWYVLNSGGTLIGPSTMFRKGDNGRIHYPGRSAAYCSSKPLPMYDWKAGDATGEGTYYERKMTTAYGMRCVKE